MVGPKFVRGAAAALTVLVAAEAHALPPPPPPPSAVFQMEEIAPTPRIAQIASESYASRRENDFREAFNRLRVADQAPVHEGPRFIYLPQLAFLASMSGDVASARRYARMAVAAYDIFTGTAYCPPDFGPEVAPRLRHLREPLPGDEEREIIDRMCAAMISYDEPRTPRWEVDGIYAVKLQTVTGMLD